MHFWQRLKKLGELSAPSRSIQRTWNGEPVTQDVFEEKMGFKVGQTSNTPAVFIPRIKRNPVAEITQEQHD